ncbi:histidine phosphatase family protein [Actinomycetospora lutea]|uniref:histidine phosphatase family protein n=1 Tax=Actinomycetospora lutea TaxID=663604 RepID=UPI002366AD58|nr:histidine phosphatase family protein [Actinomycetospora lutea]MDD7940886.1 histidine phosphatase family protein [Actinomycetospora lutea]
MLTLVRHGQSEANARGVMCGRSDPPLTETGRRQARALAAGLPRPTRLVSSPLARARETAALFGTEVECDARWTEMDYGDLDGQPMTALDRDGWRAWQSDPEHVPAGGESLVAVRARVAAACTELAAEAATGEVVVVSHVSPIKAAISWALGVGIEIAWRMYLVDAAVCRIDTSGSAPMLLAVNDEGPLHAGTVQPA